MNRGKYYPRIKINKGFLPGYREYREWRKLEIYDKIIDIYLRNL